MSDLSVVCQVDSGGNMIQGHGWGRIGDGGGLRGWYSPGLHRLTTPG